MFEQAQSEPGHHVAFSLPACIACVRACRSIEFRLRLPGIDLWTTHKPAWSEVMLQFMLLGAVYLHK